MLQVNPTSGLADYLSMAAVAIAFLALLVSIISLVLNYRHTNKLFGAAYYPVPLVHILSTGTDGIKKLVVENPHANSPIKDVDITVYMTFPRKTKGLWRRGHDEVKLTAIRAGTIRPNDQSRDFPLPNMIDCVLRKFPSMLESVEINARRYFRVSGKDPLQLKAIVRYLPLVQGARVCRRAYRWQLSPIVMGPKDILEDWKVEEIGLDDVI